ncbi:MAG: peptide deformylase [bacterium]
MKKKKIDFIEFGNPQLRKKAKKVALTFLNTSKSKNLFKKMFNIMRQGNGVGLAAPQIGINLQIVVAEIRPTPTRKKLKKSLPSVLINPKIIVYSKNIVSDWEGCLSIPGIYAKVPRPNSIVVQYLNEYGQRVTEKASGLWGRIYQHEIDHLNGIGFMDRVKDLKTVITGNELKKLNKVKKK